MDKTEFNQATLPQDTSQSLNITVTPADTKPLQPFSSQQDTKQSVKKLDQESELNFIEPELGSNEYFYGHTSSGVDKFVDQVAKE